MPQEYNVVIAVTTCFILLFKIGRLDLLRQLFKYITTTNIIANELGNPLPDRIIVAEVKDAHYLGILKLEVDDGEASAIALSFEFDKTLLILDDLKARKLAIKLNLNFTGTMGILLKAKEAGLVATIKPILEEIQLTNFRFSENILRQLLLIAKE